MQTYDNFTCILDFDALKMVVSKSSPKINSRGIIHFPSLTVMFPRSFTMLGWFALLRISCNKPWRDREIGKFDSINYNKNKIAIFWKKIWNHLDPLISRLADSVWMSYKVLSPNISIVKKLRFRWITCVYLTMRFIFIFILKPRLNNVITKVD